MCSACAVRASLVVGVVLPLWLVALRCGWVGWVVSVRPSCVCLVCTVAGALFLFFPLGSVSALLTPRWPQPPDDTHTHTPSHHRTHPSSSSSSSPHPSSSSHTPSHHHTHTLSLGCPLRPWASPPPTQRHPHVWLHRRRSRARRDHPPASSPKKEVRHRKRQDLNLRGETPLHFECNALTTRPRLQETFVHRKSLFIYPL